jgi:hypothetical protein
MSRFRFCGVRPSLSASGDLVSNKNHTKQVVRKGGGYNCTGSGLLAAFRATSIGTSRAVPRELVNC